MLLSADEEAQRVLYPLTKPQTTAKEHTWTHTAPQTLGAVSTLRNPLSSLQASSRAKLSTALLKTPKNKNQPICNAEKTFGV